MARRARAPDVVLAGQRLEDGDGEGEAVLGLARHLLGQQPRLCVVHVLGRAVLHPDVPLRRSSSQQRRAVGTWNLFGALEEEDDS